MTVRCRRLVRPRPRCARTWGTHLGLRAATKMRVVVARARAATCWFMIGHLSRALGRCCQHAVSTPFGMGSYFVGKSRCIVGSMCVTERIPYSAPQTCSNIAPHCPTHYSTKTNPQFKLGLRDISSSWGCMVQYSSWRPRRTSWCSLRPGAWRRTGTSTPGRLGAPRPERSFAHRGKGQGARKGPPMSGMCLVARMALLQARLLRGQHSVTITRWASVVNHPHAHIGQKEWEGMPGNAYETFPPRSTQLFTLDALSRSNSHCGNIGSLSLTSVW